jgi:hypothetical protein
MQNPVGANPNASVTAISGSVSVLVVWFAGIVGLAMTAEVGSAFTTLVAAIILWMGRRERRASATAVTDPSPTS